MFLQIAAAKAGGGWVDYVWINKKITSRKVAYIMPFKYKKEKVVKGKVIQAYVGTLANTLFGVVTTNVLINWVTTVPVFNACITSQTRIGHNREYSFTTHLQHVHTFVNRVPALPRCCFFVRMLVVFCFVLCMDACCFCFFVFFDMSLRAQSNVVFFYIQAPVFFSLVGPRTN